MRIAMLLGLGLLLALVENWMLWGYFVSRSTLVGELQDGDTLIAFSMLDFGSGPTLLARSERTVAAAAAASFCHPPTNECREGRLALRLQRLYGSTETTPDVGQPLLNAAWTELTRVGWLPKASSPAYKGTGVPVAGLAILFRKAGNQEHLLLAYRTSEIANDVYAYSEALFRVAASGPSLVKQIHFFLDIAGIEGLEWPILWPLNVILLFLFWAVVVVGRIAYRKGSTRATPSQGATPSE